MSRTKARGKSFSPSRRSRALAIALAAALLIGAGLWIVATPAHRATSLIGGPFTLTNQEDQRVDQPILKGKWTAVFFGYTHCPDVCPLTLQSLPRTKAALGKDAGKLQIVFIPVDPERDSPANMKAYLASGGFPPGVIGLTGTPEEVKAVEKAYRVTASKSGDGDNYTYNHTAVIFLMNPKGQFDSPLMSDITPQQSADQIKDSMKAAT